MLNLSQSKSDIISRKNISYTNTWKHKESGHFFFLLIQFNPEDESDSGRLQKLFDVSRVIMKAKNESCEEIMEEYEKEVKASKKKGGSRSLEKKSLKIVLSLKDFWNNSQ